MAQKQKGNFGEGNVSKLIIKLALPIMAAEVVHVLYNIVDRIFIGHLPEVGTAALTGVGIAFPLITLVNAFANLFVTGGSTIASIARGQDDDAKAQRVIETSLTTCIAVGAILTIVFYTFCSPLLNAMGGEPETLPYAVEYFKIYALGCIPVMISFGMNNFITAQGFATTGMLTVIIGAVLNLGLDPLLMYTFNMGIKGAAIATVISQTVSAIWVIAFLTGKKPEVPVRHFILDFAILKEIVKLGITGFMFRATTSVTQAVVNITLRTFGGEASMVYIGSMSIINSVREIASIPINGLSSGYVPVASYNYGAKKWDRLDKAIGVGVRFSVVLAGSIWLLMLLFPRQLIELFSEDTALIETAIPCLRIYFIFFICMAFQVIGQNTFVAMNYPKYALFFSLLRKIIVILPLTLILPRVGMGVMGVFWAEAISNIIGGAAAFSTMVCVIWKKVKKLAAGDTSVEV